MQELRQALFADLGPPLALVEESLTPVNEKPRAQSLRSHFQQRQGQGSHNRHSHRHGSAKRGRWSENQRRSDQNPEVRINGKNIKRSRIDWASTRARGTTRTEKNAKATTDTTTGAMP